MKKLLITGIVCSMVLSAPISAAAAEIQPTCSIGGCHVGECFMNADADGMCGDHCFTDEDGDGVCDNHCYIDEDNDGICDHYIDDDSDGVCDHCHEHGKPVQKAVRSRRSGHHSGRGSGHHGGHCR